MFKSTISLGAFSIHACLILSWMCFATAAIDIATLDGVFYPAITQHVFDHTTLGDPVAPNGTGTTVLLTFYYPTLQKPNTTRPYLDNVTASIYKNAYAYSPGTLANLTTNLTFQASIVENVTYPATIIFQPAIGTPSAFYTALLSSLAAQGYFVAALDYPYEAPFLQYPYGGPGIYGLPANTSFSESLTQAIYDIRLADTAAFIDFFPGLVAEFGASFNTTNYGIFGNGLGAAAAIGALLQHQANCSVTYNATISAGGNLDGALLGAPASGNTSSNASPAPVLLMGGLDNEEEVRNVTRDQTWRRSEDAQSGFVYELLIDGAQYLDFSDWTLLKELGGRTPHVGSINRTKMISLVKRNVEAFFELAVGAPQPTTSAQPEKR